MNRRYRERRRRRRYNYDRPRWGFTSAFRRPGVQIAVLLIVALIIFIILQSGGEANPSLLPDIW